MSEGQEDPEGDPLLAGLLSAARHAGPDELDALVARTGRRVGAHDVCLYLVDHEQRKLWPLRGGQRGGEHDVEASLAGRTYRSLQACESATDEGVRLWLPLLDGSDRLGVLAVDLARAPDEATMSTLWGLALVSAGLVVSKHAYSDAYELVRRREHATLPTEIQQELLPPLSASTADVAIAGTLEPAYAVAGDAFDYAINADTVQWVVLDAMGHGLEAAVLVSVAVAAHRYARRRGRGLREGLAEMDATVATHFGGDRFLTGLLGELDRRTGRLRLLAAGHHPPLLVRDGAVVADLASDPALPIGLNADRPLPECRDDELEPGDRVLAYTDGVIEARSPVDGSLFGIDRLTDVIGREFAAEQPAPESMRRLMRHVLEHHRYELRDDAMLLLLEWFGPSRDDQPLK